jgi:hypothetical protein
VHACGGSYARLCSFCFATVRFTMLILRVSAHFVFSGGLDCSVRAHACVCAAPTKCSSASLLHVALLVFWLIALYLCFLCSYAPYGFAFALSQCTQGFYAPAGHHKWFSLVVTSSLTVTRRSVATLRSVVINATLKCGQTEL